VGGDAGNIFIYFVSDQSAASPPALTANGGLGGAAGQEGAPGQEGVPGPDGGPSDYSHTDYKPADPPKVGTKGNPGAKGNAGVNGKTGNILMQAVPIV
jgi:hypothetical protein